LATARELLLQALHAIISKAYSEEGKVALKRLLNSYRVQTKSGEALEKNQTARELLVQNIINYWQHNGGIDKKTLINLISSFRMQVKHGLSRPVESLLGNKVSDESSSSNTRAKVKENISRHQNAYFKSKNDHKKNHILESSVAGGPLPKKQGRAQCPKCRSMGVVLARAYGGEDYCSCIYCGFQAHPKTINDKLDLPMAAEILNATVGEPKLDPEE
jgi:hypothetical protein